MPSPATKISLFYFERTGQFRPATWRGDSLRVTGRALERAWETDDPFVVIIDEDELSAHAVARLTELVWNSVPLVIGPKASANELLWELKPTVDARGGIFEIASNKTDFSRRLASVTAACERRLEAAPVRERTDVLTNLAWWIYAARSDIEPANVARFVGLSKADDPVAELPGVIAATKDLRSDRGRLDTNKIAELFGITRAELARKLDVAAETLRVTPDAPSVQEKLKPYEKVARLLTFVRTPENFRKWLNTPNPELGEKAPAEVLASHGPDTLALLVDNILTNRGR